MSFLLRDQRGFTLLEVGLSMFILALISLGVAAGLSAGIRAWESGERDLDYYQRKRIVYDRITDEISGAINLRGKTEEDERRKMIFDGESDKLAFITTSPAITSPSLPSGLKELQIYVDPGAGLVFREALFSSTDFFGETRGFEYILDPFVTEIGFRYLYLPVPDRTESDLPTEGEWLSTWGPEHIEIEETTTEEEDGSVQQTREVRNHLPIAVEVTISTVNPDSNLVETWLPIIVPLKEARVLGVSKKRRSRK